MLASTVTFVCCVATLIFMCDVCDTFVFCVATLIFICNVCIYSNICFVLLCYIFMCDACKPIPRTCTALRQDKKYILFMKHKRFYACKQNCIPLPRQYSYCNLFVLHLSICLISFSPVIDNLIKISKPQTPGLFWFILSIQNRLRSVLKLSFFF